MVGRPQQSSQPTRPAKRRTGVEPAFPPHSRTKNTRPIPNPRALKALSPDRADGLQPYSIEPTGGCRGYIAYGAVMAISLCARLHKLSTRASMWASSLLVFLTRARRHPALILETPEQPGTPVRLAFRTTETPFVLWMFLAFPNDYFGKRASFSGWRDIDWRCRKNQQQKATIAAGRLVLYVVLQGHGFLPSAITTADTTKPLLPACLIGRMSFA